MGDGFYLHQHFRRREGARFDKRGRDGHFSVPLRYGLAEEVVGYPLLGEELTSL
jgi:hypothetical protein